MSDLLTTRELAAFLRCSEDAVYRWAASGAIPSLRLPGGGLRFDAAAVLGALGRVAATQPEEAA